MLATTTHSFVFFTAAFALFACASEVGTHVPPDDVVLDEGAKPDSAEDAGVPSVPVDCPDPQDPMVAYVDQDPETCDSLFIECGDREPFSDACGCGCLGHVPPPMLTSASPEEEEWLTAKRMIDVDAVHRNDRVASTDLYPYPDDFALPQELADLVLDLPFASGSWVRCQQGNNTMDHHERAATHGPHQTLRYSLDLNFDADEAGAVITAAAGGTAYVFDGARPIGQGEWDLERGRDNGGLGNFVAVVHGNGFASLYSHLDDVLVESGARVERSAPIGVLGRSGGAGVAHLHFHVVPVYRVPEPGVAEATDHVAFSVEYNRTFGPSVPFRIRVGRFLEGRDFEEILDSRQFESDYYRTNATPVRSEPRYWHRAL